MLETIEELIQDRKPTHLMVLDAFALGQRPVTKLGGAPCWPRELPRPHCQAGHAMSFFAQVRLSDVPGFRDDPALLSLHYCVACADEGQMSFGYDDTRNPSGYRVDLFPQADAIVHDGLGVVGKLVPERVARFVPTEEVMALDDYWGLTDQSFDYPIEAQDFDAEGYPDYANKDQAKTGGWPSWVQSADWLTCPHGRPYHFVAQVGDEVLPDGAWASGGFGYLWACDRACDGRRADMSAQST
jgi:hypothetical protein